VTGHIEDTALPPFEAEFARAWNPPGHTRHQLRDTDVNKGSRRPLHHQRAADLPSPWLFPGHRPGSALTEGALAQRLHAIGIGCSSSGGTADLGLCRVTG
jgi:hypothetical protein